MNLKTLKSQVRYILENNIESRNSDITLMIEVWKKFYGVQENIDLYQLYDLPREDNIKRIRAKFQNEDGLYLPTTWEVAKRRGIEENKWRVFMGYPPIQKALLVDVYEQKQGNMKLI
jgi:hypothetical protein